MRIQWNSAESFPLIETRTLNSISDNHFVRMLYSYVPAWWTFVISTTLVILIALKIRKIHNDIRDFKREEMNPKQKSKFTGAKEE